MNYNALTKAQLIDKVKKLEQQTVSARMEQLMSEAKLMADDLVKLVQYIYNLGVSTHDTLTGLNPIKSEPPLEQEFPF